MNTIKLYKADKHGTVETLRVKITQTDSGKLWRANKKRTKLYAVEVWEYAAKNGLHSSARKALAAISK